MLRFLPSVRIPTVVQSYPTYVLRTLLLDKSHLYWASPESFPYGRVQSQRSGNTWVYGPIPI